MRKAVSIALVCAVAMAALAGVASAQSNKAKAVAAVKEAVAEKWITFEVGPPSYLNVDGAHISVSCTGLSSSKFKCNWTANNDLKQHATGGAIVTTTPRAGSPD